MKLYKHTNTKQAAKLSKRLNKVIEELVKDKAIEELVKDTDIYIPLIKTKEFFNFDPIGDIELYEALYVINGFQLEQAQLSLAFDIVKALGDIVKGETSYIETENPSGSFIIQYLLNTDNGVKLKKRFNIRQPKNILDWVDVDTFLAWAVENDYLVKVDATKEWKQEPQKTAQALINRLAKDIMREHPSIGQSIVASYLIINPEFKASSHELTETTIRTKYLTKHPDY